MNDYKYLEAIIRARDEGVNAKLDSIYWFLLTIKYPDKDRDELQSKYDSFRERSITAFEQSLNRDKIFTSRQTKRK